MGNGIETECLLLSAKNYILPTRQPKTLKANHFSLSTNYPLFLPFSFCASCFFSRSKYFEHPGKRLALAGGGLSLRSRKAFQNCGAVIRSGGLCRQSAKSKVI
jgi:hypothetical protein